MDIQKMSTYPFLSIPAVRVRGIRENLTSYRKARVARAVNQSEGGKRLEKTGTKTMQALTRLTADFGLNSKYCGKPVKSFTYLKD